MDKLWEFTIIIVAASLILFTVTLITIYWVNKSHSKNKYYEKH